MAQKKPPRILFNPDHVGVVRELLTEEEAGRLFFAICDYAADGKMPEGESKTWFVCFKLLRGDVDRDRENYTAKCEKNRQNIRARWAKDTGVMKNGSDDSTVYDRIPDDSTVYGLYPTQHNATQHNAAEEKKGASPADDDLSEQIENHRRADDLIRRYRLPDSDMSREALLDDAEAVGFERLEEALRKASLSNNRQGLSINFYRSVLNGGGAKREGVSSFADIYGAI